MLAQSAFEIQKKSPGRFLVKQLLKLQATKPSSVQVMQNVVCHVGESFEQNLVEIMVTPTHKRGGSLESVVSAYWLTVACSLLFSAWFICASLLCCQCWQPAQDHLKPRVCSAPSSISCWHFKWRHRSMARMHHVLYIVLCCLTAVSIDHQLAL